MTTNVDHSPLGSLSGLFVRQSAMTLAHDVDASSPSAVMDAGVESNNLSAFHSETGTRFYRNTAEVSSVSFLPLISHSYVLPPPLEHPGFAPSSVAFPELCGACKALCSLSLAVWPYPGPSVSSACYPVILVAGKAMVLAKHIAYLLLLCGHIVAPDCTSACYLVAGMTVAPVCTVPVT